MALECLVYNYATIFHIDAELSEFDVNDFKDVIKDISFQQEARLTLEIFASGSDLKNNRELYNKLTEQNFSNMDSENIEVTKIDFDTAFSTKIAHVDKLAINSDDYENNDSISIGIGGLNTKIDGVKTFDLQRESNRTIIKHTFEGEEQIYIENLSENRTGEDCTSNGTAIKNNDDLNNVDRIKTIDYQKTLHNLDEIQSLEFNKLGDSIVPSETMNIFSMGNLKEETSEFLNSKFQNIVLCRQDGPLNLDVSFLERHEFMIDPLDIDRVRID
jgi:hypothetical protein